MSARGGRLLHLLDRLRRARRALTAAELAEGMGVSQRTLYRDIASLRAQGAEIQGDPGIGYRMRPGFLLLPLIAVFASIFPLPGRNCTHSFGYTISTLFRI